MVWAGESCSANEGRNNNGLEIGCLVDTTNGLLTFTANGKELSTHYKVHLFINVLKNVTLSNITFSFTLNPSQFKVTIYIYYWCQRKQVYFL